MEIGVLGLVLAQLALVLETYLLQVLLILATSRCCFALFVPKIFSDVVLTAILLQILIMIEGSCELFLSRLACTSTLILKLIVARSNLNSTFASTAYLDR